MIKIKANEMKVKMEIEGSAIIESLIRDISKSSNLPKGAVKHMLLKPILE